jgi:hypothetical protein
MDVDFIGFLIALLAFVLAIVGLVAALRCPPR